MLVGTYFYTSFVFLRSLAYELGLLDRIIEGTQAKEQVKSTE